MEIFGLHKREFLLHLDFIKTYLNIDSANIYTTLIAPFSPTPVVVRVLEYNQSTR